jgi:hypothetical protein
MKKVMSSALLAGLCGSSAAFAGPLFQDNKAYLYCEMVCRVDGTEVKEGVYNKNSADKFSRVKGHWEKVGFTGFLGATYIVESATFKAINDKCQEKREQLLNVKTIRGLVEDGAFSGITERSCKVYPRVATDVGAFAYQVKVAVDDADADTEL